MADYPTTDGNLDPQNRDCGENPQTVWYHGTSKELWRTAQEEGVLWGVRCTDCLTAGRKQPNRCTYLASDLKEARCYGDVVLEVTYDPTDGKNNYVDDCWQMRVYDPIPLTDVKLVA